MITIEECKEVFNELKKDRIDLTKPVTWVFSFVDEDKRKLEKLADYLSKIGFRFRAIDTTADENNKVTEYLMLHVSINFIYSPETLFKQNETFDLLVDEKDLHLYYGFNCEP